MQTNHYKNLLVQFEKILRLTWEHRKFVPASESGVPARYHGLRHTHAAEVFRELIGEGKSEYEAKKAVSRLLGHRRLDVVDVYLASLKGGEGGV